MSFFIASAPNYFKEVERLKHNKWGKTNDLQVDQILGTFDSDFLSNSCSVSQVIKAALLE
jgi:hypothetical protein